jgi:hypothetical protein
MTDTLPEMWWPSPEAFEDLTVEDAEHGFDLSAPDGTECAEWLAYWDQDETHHKVFEEEFTKILSDYANKILDTNGKDEELPDGGQEDRIQAQNDQPGAQS